MSRRMQLTPDHFAILTVKGSATATSARLALRTRVPRENLRKKQQYAQEQPLSPAYPPAK